MIWKAAARLLPAAGSQGVAGATWGARSGLSGRASSRACARTQVSAAPVAADRHADQSLQRCAGAVALCSAILLASPMAAHAKGGGHGGGGDHGGGGGHSHSSSHSTSHFSAPPSSSHSGFERADCKVLVRFHS